MLRIIFLGLCTLVLPAAEVIKAIPFEALVTSPAPAAGTEPGHLAIREGEAVAVTGIGRVLLVRLPALGAVSGVMEMVPEDADGAVGGQRVTFTIPRDAVAAAPDGTAAFAMALAQRCDALLSDRNERETGILPGSIDPGARAWWTWRRERALAVSAGNGAVPQEADRGIDAGLDRTTDLFTGMTALGENLQFDRRIAVRGEGEETVPITDLPTLTLREVPWERMPSAQDPAPAFDHLAQRIPADQHAVLLPSFGAMTATIAQGDALLAGPLHLATGRGQDAGVLRRYQHQLGLELSELSQRFGAQVIDAVAVTGSDPFLRAGSDVAILLHAKQPALLAGYLELRRQSLIAAGATAVQGSTGGLAWRGAVAADRSLSSYVLIDGEVTLVTNSPAQVEAYTAVRAKTRPALASVPEMAFFRRRYALGKDDEIALVVISDATIRRWCSARFRIGDSRRTRAAMILGDLQAQWVAAGRPMDWTPPEAGSGLGTISVDARGVRSSLYGSLHFITPIAELAIDRVTPAEAAAFRRFIDRYERSWRDMLDPIALRLMAREDGGLGLDLSVLPLIVRSDYLELLRLVGKCRIADGANDPHPAVMQIAIALDRDGETLGEMDRSAAQVLGGLASPLGWLGDGVSLYADEGPLWDEFAKVPEEERDRLLQRRLKDLPLGLNVAVRDPLGLVAFLAGIRTLSEQSAPGMLRWETRTFAEVPYVRVSPTAEGRDGMGLDGIDAQLLYLAVPEGLTITLSQAVMERAITRLKERRAAKGAVPATGPAWGGNQAAMRVQAQALALLSDIDGMTGTRGWIQRRDSDTIAILNEWRRLFPQEDPVSVHERLWGTRPVCVAGGTYRWNDEWLTMESSAVGFSSTGATGPQLPAGLERIGVIAAGLSFEDLPAAAPTAGGDEPGPGERLVIARQGDTWRSIARSTGVSQAAIERRNPKAAQAAPAPGSRVIIPSWEQSEARSVGLRVRLEVQAAPPVPPAATAPAVP
jgi:hypothetical protein